MTIAILTTEHDKNDKKKCQMILPHIMLYRRQIDLRQQQKNRNSHHVNISVALNTGSVLPILMLNTMLKVKDNDLL